ncbi:uncharacterized protein [Littorina saxatilis]|uniref:uncharacterized protein n=1 Tax=Littorina saxatilis TaxID=31220 RepID=UPI0038B46F68
MTGIRILLLGLLLLQTIRLGNFATTIECQTGHAFEGEPSNITCIFSENIKDSKAAFNVAKYAIHSDGDGDVLQCSWAKNTEKPECLVTGGYEFNYEISDRLTVTIPSTRASFAGNYSCHIVPPPAGVTVKSCSLSVSEKPTSYSTTTQTTQPPVSSNGADTSQQSTTFHIVTIVLLVLILVLVVGFIVIFCRRNQFCSRGPPKDKRHEKVPLTEPEQGEHDSPDMLLHCALLFVIYVFTFAFLSFRFTFSQYYKFVLSGLSNGSGG